MSESQSATDVFAPFEPADVEGSIVARFERIVEQYSQRTAIEDESTWEAAPDALYLKAFAVSGTAGEPVAAAASWPFRRAAPQAVFSHHFALSCTFLLSRCARDNDLHARNQLVAIGSYQVGQEWLALQRC